MENYQAIIGIKNIIRLYSRYILLLATVIFLRCNVVVAQEEFKDHYFDLNAPITGNRIYTATNSIRLLPGFRYTATNANSFIGRINPNMILPHGDLYVDEPLNVEDIEIDTDLYFGTTAGAVDVSPLGGATYTIPIDISPGTNGVQPQISLVYNSQSGKGIAGMGWSIGGLSAITRVGKAKYIEGETTGVTMTYDDKYVLDGLRLIPVRKGVNSGTNGLEHRLEIENFSKTYSRENVGNGPKYFEVITQNGDSMFYGQNNNARIILKGQPSPSAYMLNKIVDANGNYVKYNYKNYDGENYLESIEYTGNTVVGTYPYNKIEFLYSTRADSSYYYFRGYRNNKRLLLREIRCSSEGSVYKRYELEYFKRNNYSLENAGKDNNVYLYSIKEICGSLQKNPIYFNYGEHDVVKTKHDKMDVPSFASLRVVINTDCIADYTSYMPGDFNNDGITDVVRTFSKSPYFPCYGEASYFAINLGTGNGGFDTVFYYRKILSKSLQTHAHVCDFNNDGYDDLLIEYAESTDGNKPKFHYLLYLNYSFREGEMFEQVCSFSVCDWIDNLSISDISFSDIDSDGYTDVIITKKHKEGSTEYSSTNVMLLKFDNGSYSFLDYNSPRQNNASPNAHTIPFSAYKQTSVYVHDITGNGNPNILINDGSWLHVYEYDKGKDMIINVKTLGYPNYWHHQFYGDFNGDGLIDVFTVGRNENYKIKHIGLNTGDTIFNHDNNIINSLSINNIEDLLCKPLEYRILINDINRDGYSDIIQLRKMEDSSVFSISIAYSNGYRFNNSFFVFPTQPNYFIMESRYDLVSFANFNKNNGADLCIMSECYDCGTNFLDFFPKSDNGLLTKVRDGVGNITSINYDSGLNPSIYQTDTIFANADNTLIKTLPLTYVSSINDKITTTKFTYANLICHKKGKGLIGFYRTERENDASKHHIINNYSLTGYSDCLYNIKSTYEYVDGNLIRESNYLYETFPGTLHRDNDQQPPYYQPIKANTLQQLTQSVEIDYILNSKKVSGFTNQDLNILNLPKKTVTNIYALSDITNSLLTIIDETKYDDLSYGNCPFKIFVKEKSTEMIRSGESITNKQIYTYYPNGRANTITNRNISLPSTMEIMSKNNTYDSFGHVTSTTVSGDGISRSSSVMYDVATGRFPKSQTDALGYTSTATYDGKTGNILKSTDVNGLVAEYQYDAFGMLIKGISPSKLTTDTKCDWVAKLPTSGMPNIPDDALYYNYQQTEGAPAQYDFYDKHSNLLRTAVREPQLSSNNNAWLYTDIEYDAFNRVSKKYLPYHGSKNKFAEYSYVSSGRYTGSVDKFMSPDSSYVIYAYNGKEVSESYYVDESLHSTTRKTVDELGNLLTTDEEGGIITYQYYCGGQVKSVTCSPKNGGAPSTTSFEYDAMGNRIKITDPDAGVIRTAYNAFGEVLKHQTAEQANIERFPAQYVSTQYDVGGRVISQKTVTGSFDENSGAQSDLITYLYSEISPIKGMLKSDSSATAKKEYFYDNYLRLKQVKESVMSNGAVEKDFTFKYEYDIYGRLSKETYPEGSVLTYGYDNYGYPVNKKLANAVIWEAKDYGEQGQLISHKIGNNTTITKGFDNKGRLTNITATGANNTIYQNMSYGYHPDGNMSFRTDVTISKKEWFQYDKQNRLIGWETTNLYDSEPTYLTRIEYAGNRISQKENIGAYTYSELPHHGVESSGKTYVSNIAVETAYDHNRIDGRARVSKITLENDSVVYTYGTADELIKKVEKKGKNLLTTYYAAGGRYELRVDNTTNTETKLLYLGSGVVKYDAPGTVEDKMLYLLKDHLGSIVKVLSINSNGVNVVESFSYDVWGNRRNSTDWTYTGINVPNYIFKGFTGHEHIEGFGLIHMKGRVYDPALGMFLSPDPYVQSSTAMGFNRYMYCMGNPLMYTDPDGEWVHLVIGAVIGGIVNWATHGCEFTWKGLGYFGIGAAAGALGAGIGAGAATAMLTSAVGFGAGFVGTATVVGGAGGFVSGMIGGMTSGLITGSANAWMNGASFGNGLSAGLDSSIKSGIGGAVAGLTIGGLSAVNSGREFMSGSYRQYKLERAMYASIDGNFSEEFITPPKATIINEDEYRVYYKPEGRKRALNEFVEPGSYLDKKFKIDGVATSKHTDQVFKVPDGSRVKVYRGGDVEFEVHGAWNNTKLWGAEVATEKSWIAYEYKYGWLYRENLDKYWDKLFDAAKLIKPAK